MPGRTTDTQKRLLQLISILIMGAAIWSFLPTLKFDFTLFDDQKILLEQSKLFAQGSVGQRVENIVFNDYPREEPLITRDLSWLLDSVIFKPGNPFGYHFSNVLYHGLVLFLAFWLLVQLTGTRVAIISLSIILVLAVHVEPVAWIMGRKDILSALFCLLSMHFYLRFRRHANKRLRILLYGMTVVSSVAAYLSKISVVVLPVLLALVALFEFIDTDAPEKLQPEKNKVRRIALEIAPILLLALIVYSAYQAVLKDFGILERAYPYSTSDYLKVAFLVNPLVLVEYLKLVFAPYNLYVIYDDPSITSTFAWWDYLKATSTLILIGLITWHMWRSNKKALLLLACFFITLLPYGNWKYFGFSYANRYLYFAVLFLIPALVSYLLPYYYKTKTWTFKIGLVIIFLVVVVNNISYRQQYLYVWENGESLWLNEINGPNPSLHDYNSLTGYYLARAKYARNEFENNNWLAKARTHNTEILEMSIKHSEPEWLAKTYIHQGLLSDDLTLRLQAFERAVNNAPTNPYALHGLAASYLMLAQSEQSTERRTEYAELSLQYFRGYIMYSDKTAESANTNRELLNRLKTEFSALEIPELGSESIP